ncbi:MAG TPA: SAF domain-containing protein [Gaiellales bacterium]|nr:SAF domain-containing protein [Gaiellales bacterium]
MSRHRRRALVYTVVAVMLAVVGLIEIGRGTGPARRIATVAQVVVVRALPAGTTLSTDDVGVVRVPVRYAMRGGIGDPDAAVGRRTAVPLPAGAPLMAAEIEAGDRIAAARDVALRLDDEAGLPAGNLAGARADVLLVRPGPASEPTVVLANVLVVSARSADGAAVATLRLPAPAVSLAVAAEGRGSLRLVVRAPAEGR